MPTSAQTQINRVRQTLRDWPTPDALTAAITTAGQTSMTVADATIYSPNWVVQIDQEAMIVATASGTTVTFRQRGARGTTAATHLIGATIFIRPGFLDVEILDAFNAGIDACYPYIYQEVVDTSLTVTTTAYEYTVPQVNSAYIPRIWKIETQTPGDGSFRKVEDWRIVRGATPKIKFREIPYPGAVLRVTGYAPFAHLTATDSMSAQWPGTADFLPGTFAASQLLASGEAGRVRQSSGSVDTREQANRTGSSSAAGRDLYQRFKDQLLNGGHMVPLQGHIVTTY